MLRWKEEVSLLVAFKILPNNTLCFPKSNYSLFPIFQALSVIGP